MNKAVTVFVVDDDPDACRLVQSILRSAGYEVESFASAEEYLDQDSDRRRGCLLIDLHLPSMMGDELHRRLSEAGDRRPVIFVSANVGTFVAVSLMKNGAMDVIEKPFDRTSLLNVVHTAIQREALLYQQQHRAIAMSHRLNKLTPRESEVMQLVADGKANKVVAQILSVSERTVETYRARVMEKLDISSVSELVRFADAIARRGVMSI